MVLFEIILEARLAPNHTIHTPYIVIAFVVHVVAFAAVGGLTKELGSIWVSIDRSVTPSHTSISCQGCGSPTSTCRPMMMSGASILDLALLDPARCSECRTEF